jgi:hypothetical protein
MSKPFDPFSDEQETTAGDDELEYQPEPTRIEAAPEPSAETVIKPGRSRPLKIDFSELADQGGDLRGALAIGSEELPSDEFLRGLKKRDYDQALDRAVSSQRMISVQAADEGKVVRKVRTPLYLMAAAVLGFVALLVAGGFAFKAYTEHVQSQRVEELRRAKP